MRGRIKNPQGYVLVREPDHPLAKADGYVLEHRKVVHDAGIEIPPGHVVHHINGRKDDNRLENLEVLSMSAHRRTHRGPIRHGQRAAYASGGCRCDLCRNAERVYQNRRRARLREKSRERAALRSPEGGQNDE